MAKMINSKWKEKMIEIINSVETLDVTISFNPARQWLIERLTDKGKIFRVYNLGAGVKRITTETSQCPCCKRDLEK